MTSVRSQEIPGTPDVSCLSTSTDQIRFGWTAVDDVKEYKLRWSGRDLAYTGKLVPATTTEYTKTGLTDGSWYQFWVWGKSTTTLGIPGSVTCRTADLPELERPRITRVERHGEDHLDEITVHWAAVENADSYDVELNTAHPGGGLTPHAGSETGLTDTHKKFTGLAKPARYAVNITVHAAGYESKKSLTYYFTTLADTKYNITLSVDRDRVPEGESGTITLTADRPIEDTTGIAISISASFGDYYSPSSEAEDTPWVQGWVGIPHNQTSATAKFTTRHDADLDDDGVGIWFRSSDVTQFSPAWVAITVIDDGIAPTPVPTPQPTAVPTQTPTQNNTLEAKLAELERLIAEIRQLLRGR